MSLSMPDATFVFCCLPKVQIQLKMKIVNRNDETGCSNLHEPVVVLSNVGLHGSSRLLRTERQPTPLFALLRLRGTLYNSNP
jgi:hypothetical protein